MSNGRNKATIQMKCFSAKHPTYLEWRTPSRRFWQQMLVTVSVVCTNVATSAGTANEPSGTVAACTTSEEMDFQKRANYMEELLSRAEHHKQLYKDNLIELLNDLFEREQKMSVDGDPPPGVRKRMKDLLMQVWNLDLRMSIYDILVFNDLHDLAAEAAGHPKHSPKFADINKDCSDIELTNIRERINSYLSGAERSTDNFVRKKASRFCLNLIQTTALKRTNPPREWDLWRAKTIAICEENLGLPTAKQSWGKLARLLKQSTPQALEEISEALEHQGDTLEAKRVQQAKQIILLNHASRWPGNEDKRDRLYQQDPAVAKYLDCELVRRISVRLKRQTSSSHRMN